MKLHGDAPDLSEGQPSADRCFRRWHDEGETGLLGAPRANPHPTSSDRERVVQRLYRLYRPPLRSPSCFGGSRPSPRSGHRLPLTDGRRREWATQIAW
jgi:hypothetical protein